MTRLEDEARPTWVYRVRASQALDVKRALVELGLLSSRHRVVREGEHVRFPVTDDAQARGLVPKFGGEVDEAAAPPLDRHRDPHERMRRLLENVLDSALLDALPRKWERLGHVAVVKLDAVLAPHAALVGHALADAVGVETVLEDCGGVEGELREMTRTRLLHGSDTVTTHLEHDVRYHFDAARIMFSSGNVEERARMGRIDARGEVVADMFAGIGYFALPLAKFAGARRVVAIEKNPLSHRFLVENARLNDVDDVLDAWLGDNRDYPDSGFADRVVMGYFPGTRAFLPTALRFAKPGGATIHYHDTAPADRISELADSIESAGRAAGFEVEVDAVRVVKTFSPGMVHAVADVRVRAAPRPSHDKGQPHTEQRSNGATERRTAPPG